MFSKIDSPQSEIELIGKDFNAMKKWMVALVLQASLGISHAPAAPLRWNLSPLELRPGDEQTRQISFRAGQGGGKQRAVSARVVLTSITTHFVLGDTLAILGDAGQAQAVVIISICVPTTAIQIRRTPIQPVQPQ